MYFIKRDTGCCEAHVRVNELERERAKRQTAKQGKMRQHTDVSLE